MSKAHRKREHQRFLRYVRNCYAINGSPGAKWPRRFTRGIWKMDKGRCRKLRVTRTADGDQVLVAKP